MYIDIVLIMTKLHKKYCLFALGMVMSVSVTWANRLTVGNVNATYRDLVSATDAALSNDTIFLTSDVELSSSISLARDLTIQSDSGYRIIRKSPNLPGTVSPTIYVNTETTLELVNICLDANNQSSNYESPYSHFVSVNSGATLRMDYRTSIINSTNGAVLNAQGTVIGGRVMNNSSSESSVGVIYVTSGGALINMVITSNKVSRGMAVVKMSGGRMINCTVVNNNQNSNSERYAVDASGTGCKVYNSIIYSNKSSFMGNTPDVQYSCVDRGTLRDGNTDSADKNGNINVSPCLNSDLSLKKASPCVNAGNSSYIEEYTQVDAEGNRRIRLSSVDMGAYEYQPEYFRVTDNRVTCGDPFVWIDGNTYTESTNTPRDTIDGGADCDTIVILNLQVKNRSGFSDVPSEDLVKTGCEGDPVQFSYTPAETDSSFFRWENAAGNLLLEGTTLDTVIGSSDQDYYLISSFEDGTCADTLIYSTKVERSIELRNFISQLEYDAYDDYCFVDELYVPDFVPDHYQCFDNYVKEHYYYQVNGEGEWLDADNDDVIMTVVDSTYIYWKLKLELDNGEIVESGVSDPLLVRVLDVTPPSWIYSWLETRFRLYISDPISGDAIATTSAKSLMNAVTDKCTEYPELRYSLDGINFNSDVFHLNAFDDTSKVVYWEAVDKAGNTSEIVETYYSLQKDYEVNGKMYALVRDTFVCAEDFPFTWHGAVFPHSGESAEVGAAYLTVYADSSFFKKDSIVSSDPIVWRDGNTYDKDTIIYDYHVPNVAGCDSVFTLEYIVNHLDTTVCMGELPIVWHGQEFTQDGQTIIVGEDPYTVHVDSSYYVLDNIMQKAPFVWRDGNVYTKDTTILEYHVATTGKCDSIYSLIYVNNADTLAPILDCDNISANDRIKPLSDSISGIVEFSLSASDILSAAFDNHSTTFTTYVSEDGNSWSEFTSGNYTLNAYSNAEKTLWWKVVDDSENESAVCSTTYAIERATEKDGQLYAIVLDTLVCAGDAPLVWHGHTFTTDGESATLGAAHLTFHIDSSFFQTERIVSENPITWRDGNVYDDDIVVSDFHVANVGTCDSVFTLIFTIGRDTVAPLLDCDNISVNSRIQPLVDTISGEVTFTIPASDVLPAASDDISSELTLQVSDNNVDFYNGENYTISLNAYAEDAKTIWWRVADGANNLSASCPVTYSIERASEKDGEMYAAVLDTFICKDTTGVEWHGYIFNEDGETVVVGAAHLTMHIGASLTREDTLVVCGDSIRWIDGNVYYSNWDESATYDLVYQKVNGGGKCDSTIKTHLVVVPYGGGVSNDTTIIEGCAWDKSYMFGHKLEGDRTIYRWYLNGEYLPNLYGKKTHVMQLDGYDNQAYMVITTTPEGYCPDTSIYLTLTTHDVEAGLIKLLDFEAGENCKARVRLRDYMPDFNDHCSLEMIDTVCMYNINGSDTLLAGKNDYYEFEDGDQIVWTVGIMAPDSFSYTTSNANFHQRVKVTDRTAPKVDSLGISYGNRRQKVTDTINGVVAFNVPLSDVIDHVSDNCTNSEDLIIQYGSDTLSMQAFNGANLQLNAFTQPALLVYYAATDASGNKMIDSVLYEVKRDVKIGADSFALAIDTVVCASSFPYTWHGAEFTYSGQSAVVGAVHMTIGVDSSFFKVESVVACDSFVWRDGKTYTENTQSPIYVVENENGCDSVLTLHLTILNSSTHYDTVTICESELPYVWEGYSMMGDTVIRLTNSLSCDSLVGLKLNILPSVTEDIYETACVSYTLNGEVYTESGDYEQHFTSLVTGCDSTLTLHLTITQPDEVSETVNLCEKQLPFTWNGLEVTGDTTATLQNQMGCDSIVHLTVNILPVLTGELTETACVSYTLNDVTYTESGVYQQQFTSETTGCDSIITLNLTILQPTYGKDSMAVCETQLPVAWNGYNVMGDTTITLQNVSGCDSIVSLKLTTLPVAHETVLMTVCSSQLPFVWNDMEVTSDTSITLSSVAGCDSVVSLQLTVLPYLTETLYDTACVSYTLNGETYTESGVYEQRLRSTAECDSILTLHLVINQPTESEQYETACESYTFNDVTYTESGDYTHTFVSAAGCDSVVTLHLTILQPVYGEETISVCAQSLPYQWKGFDIYSDTVLTIQGDAGCDSIVSLKVDTIPTAIEVLTDTACSVYSLNGVVYRESGVYQQKFTSLVTGCDSILQLNLTILQPTEGTDSVTTCSSQLPIAWNGYEVSHDTTIIIENSLGCDSILTLALTIIPEVRETLYDTACGALTYNGVLYTQSGVYEQRFISEVTGCDSVLELNLTIHQEAIAYDTITLCRDQLPYVWHGHKIESDTTLSIQRENGCDSVVKFTMNILPVMIENIYAVACERYLLNDFIYLESGTYDQRFESKITGCDSIIRLNLTILSPSSSSEKINICANELPYVWEGHEIVGDTVLTISNMAGCDSTVTLNLNVFPIHTTVLYDTTCGVYSFNGTLYNESGVYEQRFTSNVTGCDSIVILHLTVRKPSSGTENITLCDNEPFAEWNGYRIYGDTTITIENSVGCDSIVAISLTRLPSSTTTLTETACVSYEWNDSTYTTSGIYKRTFVNQFGCDSVVTLNLTILQPTSSSFSETAVAFYDWNDELYEASGTYVQTLKAANGCDSVVTLNLTILPTLAEIDTLSFTVCENEMPYEWNGNLLNKSKSIFNFKNELGQDSLVVVYLDILPAGVSYETAESCDSYNWHGKVYRRSGEYVDTLSNVNGCDSICNLSLTIYTRTETRINLVACSQELPLSWHGFVINSDTSFVLTSTHGCDSIITIDLTVHESKISEPEVIYTCLGQYEWRGKMYKTNGIYYDTLSTLYGCDSILAMQLVVTPLDTLFLQDTVTLGLSYKRNEFDLMPEAVGVAQYNKKMTTADGCDFIMHLDLTVLEPDIHLDYLTVEGGTVIYQGDNALGSRFCSADEFTLSYKVSGGEAFTYIVFYDNHAMDQGFEPLLGTLDDQEGSVTLPMPSNVEPGTYTVYMQVLGTYKKSELLSASIIVGMDSKYIKNSYGNVVYCDESKVQFESYQWYKDGYEIDGARDQSYRDVSGKGGVYSLTVTTSGDKEFYICGKKEGLKEVPFSIWPASAYADGGHITIYVEGVNLKDLETANLYVYTLNGVMMHHSSDVQIQNDFRLPQGVYVCRVVLENGDAAACQVVSYGKMFGYIK